MPSPADDPIGKISPPSNIPILQTPGVTSSGELPAVVLLLNRFLVLIFIVAGLYGFFNVIFAGFGFMNAGGDPKKITQAWEKIWQSLLGLLIVVLSFLFAAIIGIVLFKNPFAILNPRL